MCTQVYHCGCKCGGGAKNEKNRMNFAHHVNNSDVRWLLSSETEHECVLYRFFEYFFSYVHITHYTADRLRHHAQQTVNESSIYEILQSTKKPVLR